MIAFALALAVSATSCGAECMSLTPAPVDVGFNGAIGAVGGGTLGAFVSYGVLVLAEENDASLFANGDEVPAAIMIVGVVTGSALGASALAALRANERGGNPWGVALVSGGMAAVVAGSSAALLVTKADIRVTQGVLYGGLALTAIAAGVTQALTQAQSGSE